MTSISNNQFGLKAPAIKIQVDRKAFINSPADKLFAKAKKSEYNKRLHSLLGTKRPTAGKIAKLSGDPIRMVF